jgi:N-acetylglucosaminyl-diphospho-decaprenol L-rhamnosyltransferase
MTIAAGAVLSIDVVVPTYNGWELTRTCLEHLQLQTAQHSVIVVDNASTDGTAERVRRSFSFVHVIERADNRGFAVACNAGARAGDGDVVVLLNNDVKCPPHFLERLVAPLRENEQIGSVAAVLVKPDRTIIDSVGLTAERTFAGFPRLRGHAVADVGFASPVLAGPAGAAGAFRKVAWEQVDGLDEHVFMYGEDLDLALRLRAAGWQTAIAPDAVAVHLGSASIRHRSQLQRYHGGFARGYLLRRYGVLRSRAALRAVVTEAIVVVGDALISRDFAAAHGRIAGWRSAAGLARRPPPPREATDRELTLGESLRLRRRLYAP